MKATLLLLATACLIVAVHSYPSSGVGNRGYPAQRTAQISGWFYVSYTIAANELSLTEGTATNLRVTMDPDGLSNVATVDYYWAFNANPTLGSAIALSKGVTDETQTFTIPVYNITNGMAYGNGSGTYIVGGYMKSCSTCTGSPKTGDFFVETQLMFTTSPTSAGVAQPFPAVHNPYTIDYSTAPSTFSVPSAKLTLTDTTDIYIKVDMSLIYTVTTKIGITFKNGSIPATSSEYYTLTRYPADPAVPSAGRFTSSAVSLGPGTWYITPYCYGTSSSSSNCLFDMAIGIGSVPAAAYRNFAPSLLFTTLVAIVIGIANL